LRAEGTRVTLLSASEIDTLADAHLQAHAAELLAQAEASIGKRNLCANVMLKMESRSDHRIRKGQH
jgi:hypothetical protein